MASTKYKLFQGTDTATLEKEVNTWLSGRSPQVTVQRSDTAFAAFAVKAEAHDVGIILVSVWYTEQGR